VCKLFIAEGGDLVTPATISIPARNFVAPILRDEELIHSIEPIEGHLFFLVDTGASVTCISHGDANRLAIETRYLEPAGDVTGIGGKCKIFKLGNVEIALIEKLTEDRIWYHIEELEQIYVMDKTATKVPSILGMDLLQKFDISTKRERDTASLARLETVAGDFRITSRTIPS